MEFRYREDLESVVSEDEIIERNEIMKKFDETERITKKDAEKLFKFERKTRLCKTCGKSVFDKGVMFMPIQTDDKKYVGLFEKCFTCEMSDVMILGEKENRTDDIRKKQ